jgi:hypothetical protein
MEFAYLRARPTTRDQIDQGTAFVPRAFGGFGNQFAAFIRALFLCYIFNYRSVVAPAFTTSDGIEVLRVPPPLPPTFVPVNSFEVDGALECPLDDVAIAATAEKRSCQSLGPGMGCDTEGEAGINFAHSRIYPVSPAHNEDLWMFVYYFRDDLC